MASLLLLMDSKSVKYKGRPNDKRKNVPDHQWGH